MNTKLQFLVITLLCIVAAETWVAAAQNCTIDENRASQCLSFQGDRNSTNECCTDLFSSNDAQCFCNNSTELQNIEDLSKRCGLGTFSCSWKCILCNASEFGCGHTIVAAAALNFSSTLFLFYWNVKLCLVSCMYCFWICIFIFFEVKSCPYPLLYFG